MRETRSRWFDHKQRRPIYALVRCCGARDSRDISQTKSSIISSKKIWWEPCKIDLSTLGVNGDMILDRVLWHKRIHVANPTQWNKAFLLLLLIQKIVSSRMVPRLPSVYSFLQGSVIFLTSSGTLRSDQLFVFATCLIWLLQLLLFQNNFS